MPGNASQDTALRCPGWAVIACLSVGLSACSTLGMGEGAKGGDGDLTSELTNAARAQAQQERMTTALTAILAEQKQINRRLNELDLAVANLRRQREQAAASAPGGAELAMLAAEIEALRGQLSDTRGQLSALERGQAAALQEAEAAFDLAKETQGLMGLAEPPVTLPDSTGGQPERANGEGMRPTAATPATIKSETMPPSDAEPAGKASEPVDLDNAFALHIASFREIEASRRGWSQLQQQYPDLLAGMRARVDLLDLAEYGGRFYRLKIGPLKDASAASALCSTLEARGEYCEVTRFGGEDILAVADGR